MNAPTTYEFLRWDDLVTRDLRRPFFGIVLRVLYCLGENLLNGTLFRTLEPAGDLAYSIWCRYSP